jgi:hypothetical protein
MHARLSELLQPCLRATHSIGADVPILTVAEWVLQADVKKRSMSVPGSWDKREWGYAGAIIKKHLPGQPRGFGWDGGYGTSAYLAGRAA